nr:putative replication associated protein [Crucivirus sp.]
MTAPPKKVSKNTSDQGRCGLKRVRWVFTARAELGNEPGELPMTREDHAQFLVRQLREHCGSFVFQLEAAPTTGYLHYQGYLELLNRNRHQWIMNNIRKFEYLSPAKGSPKSNWTYCTKQETQQAGPWFLGEPRDSEQANKSAEFVKLCRTGADDDKLYDEFPSMMNAHRHTPEHIRSLHPPPRTLPLEVYLFYGPPGTGKTDFAYEQAALMQTEPYEVPLGKDFWLTPSAYGKKYVIIDEFKSNMALKDLLKLLDKRPIQVPVKGSFVWWCPEIIVITTNKNPWEWYGYVDRDFEREALFRRIHYTFVFEKNAEGVPKPKEVTLDSLKPTAPLQLQHWDRTPGPRRFNPYDDPCDFVGGRDPKTGLAPGMKFNGGKFTKIPPSPPPKYSYNHINRTLNIYKPMIQKPVLKDKPKVIETPLVVDLDEVIVPDTPPPLLNKNFKPIMVFDDGTPGDKISFDDPIETETQPMDEISDAQDEYVLTKKFF